MNKKITNKELDAVLVEIEQYNNDEDAAFALNVEAYERFKIVFSQFRKLVTENNGVFNVVNCHPCMLGAGLTIHIPLLDLYGQLVLDFAQMVSMCNVFSVSPTMDGIYIEANVNDLWVKKQNI